MSELWSLRHSQQTKVDVNRALDAAAGHVLSIDERRAWWVTNERFARMLQPAQYDTLMDEARRYSA